MVFYRKVRRCRLDAHNLFLETVRQSSQTQLSSRRLRLTLISWTKFDLMNVPNCFQLQARCGPLVAIFAESLLLKAPRSASGDCSVGGCPHRSDSNAHLAHLALPATFHTIPKVDFRRARRHVLTNRASMAHRAALVLTTHLSTFCCCLLAGRARDVL